MSKPEGGGYVTVVPWYDRAGFAEICTTGTGAGHDEDYDYDRWRGQATRAIEALLRTGQAIEIVTIDPADYRAWLVLHAHRDSRASRQRFVSQLASG